MSQIVSLLTMENYVTVHAVNTVKTKFATKQPDIAFPVLTIGQAFSVKMR